MVTLDIVTEFHEELECLLPDGSPEQFFLAMLALANQLIDEDLDWEDISNAILEEAEKCKLDLDEEQVDELGLLIFAQQQMIVEDLD